MFARFLPHAIVFLSFAMLTPGQDKKPAPPPKAVPVVEEEATPGTEEKLTEEEKKALEAEKAKEKAKEKPAVVLGPDGKPLPPQPVDPRGALEKALADNLLSMGKDAVLVKTKERKTPPDYYVVYVVSTWDSVCKEGADKLAAFYRQGLKNYSLPFEVVMVVKNTSSDVAEQFFKKGNWPFALLVPAMQRSLTTLLNLDRADSSPMLLKVDREGLLLGTRQAEIWDEIAVTVARQGEPPPEPVVTEAKLKKSGKKKK